MKLVTAHQQEWQNSGVSDEIIAQNVTTLTDNQEIANKLGWKSWKNGQGWLVSGIDPKTGDRTLEGAQFKPDTPTTSNSGKPQKYLSRKGATSPLFLAAPKPDFWSGILDNNEPILITEGAKKAGIAITLGVPCISLPGVANGQKGDRLHPALKQFCTYGRKFYLAFDADLWDNLNVARELDRLARLLSAEGGVVYVLTWNKENGKGLDDWLVSHDEGDRPKKLQNAIALAKTMAEYRKINGSAKEPKIKLNFYQEMMRDLYCAEDDRWVVVDGKFYHWNGIYYQHSPEEVQKYRVQQYCDKKGVEDKDGFTTFPYATPGYLTKALIWAKAALGRSPESVNPAGLNCINGVLKINWEWRDKVLMPVWELRPHTPDIVYLYEPSVRYDPEADSTDCDRLLECLDPDQREIFLRTIAASLDFETVRSVKGRAVRALMLKGGGNNGKDTLREVLSMIYGHQGLTACTFADFAAYDTGRKFPLAKLQYSRVNWSPENSPSANLDSLQSLKAAISGDVLDYEGKGKDERSGNAKAVFLFNCNEAPNFVGALEAIRSRYAVLSFNKTYTVGADPRKGELEADSRFKYDMNFVRDRVLPAFLNKMLSALADLMVEGINYMGTSSALEEIQREKNHLYQFAADAGLDYDPEASVYVGQVWDKLHQWYIDNGTISVEANGKEVWTEQVRSRDKNVKGSNQVMSRILELFPKAKKGKKDVRGMKIMGLRFFDPTEQRELSAQCDSSTPEAQETPKIEEVSENSQNGSTASNQEKAIAQPVTVSASKANDAPSEPPLEQRQPASGFEPVASKNGHHPQPDNVTVEPMTTEDALCELYPGLKNFDWKG